MDIEVLVKRQPCCQKHRRPKHAMRFDDILADEMLCFRPKFLKLAFASALQSADVVDQRVKPNVGHISIVERKLDPPGEPALGTGYAEVFDRLS
jgi:hypothetical protein